MLYSEVILGRVLPMLEEWSIEQPPEVSLDPLIVIDTDTVVPATLCTVLQYTMYYSKVCCVHFTVYAIRCTLYPLPCTLYPVPCSLHPIHCTLYTVQYVQSTMHYVFRSIVALHSFRLKLCSDKCIVQCTALPVWTQWTIGNRSPSRSELPLLGKPAPLKIIVYLFI